MRPISLIQSATLLPAEVGITTVGAKAGNFVGAERRDYNVMGGDYSSG